MDDRELLEMAAKAAGIEFKWRTRKIQIGMTDTWGVRQYREEEQPFLLCGVFWNPLGDDAQAFRLSIQLRIKIEYVEEMDSAMCSLPGSMGATSVSAIGNVELRHAIVQAAAQHGLSMP